VQLAGQRRREVEAEAVDVHLGDPVAQRVHEQLQHVRVAHVERVAGPRVVHVVATVVGDQAVVGGVVGALVRQRRTHVVALGGVVVDDVEDHLDPGVVEGAHHALELLHLVPARARRRVPVVRGQVADRVVAPVVAQPLLDEVAVLRELVDREELDGGHAEAREVVDGLGRGQAGVGATQLRGHRRVGGGEPLDVDLVDDRLVPRRAGRPVVGPVEEGADDHRALGVGSAVRIVRRAVGVAEVVAEHGLVPVDLALDRLAVRVSRSLAGLHR
jgi:hypothetical protein